MMTNCILTVNSLNTSLQRRARGFFILILLIFIPSITQAQYAPVGQFQLATPAIEVSSTFFNEATTVRLDLDVEGVTLRYALGNAEVSESSNIYKGPISIRQSTTIQAKAYHQDYQDSDVVEVSVFRMVSQEQLKVSTNSLPAPQYAGEGAVSLADKRKGSMNFRDGRWLGFSTDTVLFEVNVKTNAEILTLSLMEDHGSWIFAPQRVEVWEGGTLLGSWNAATPDYFLPKSFRFIEVPLKSTPGDLMQVQVITGKIPDWHDGKGTTPWLFIDEIFISN